MSRRTIFTMVNNLYPRFAVCWLLQPSACRVQMFLIWLFFLVSFYRVVRAAEFSESHMANKSRWNMVRFSFPEMLKPFKLKSTSIYTTHANKSLDYNWAVCPSEKQNLFRVDKIDSALHFIFQMFFEKFPPNCVIYLPSHCGKPAWDSKMDHSIPYIHFCPYKLC